jgi:RNA polymerase sigma-70 factor (ECF subfamily)
MTPLSAPPLDADLWLQQHGDALYRYALLQLRDTHQAEEVVQETLVSAWQARESFRGDANVRTWLTGILKRKILDQYRREQRERPLADELDAGDAADDSARQFQADGHWTQAPADWGDPQRLLENDQFWKLLQFCLDRIPSQMAQIFMLREIQEQSTKNICKDLSITPSNLWTTLYRARMGLRKCLDREWREGG